MREVLQAQGRRIGLTLALVAFAVLAVISGADRLSAERPGFARFVPPAFRAHAARSAAALALAQARPARAEGAAELAVRNDPVDPSSDALLGSAWLALERPAEAEQAFRVAGQFGWREPMTQLYWFDAALRSGNIAHAAMRADAILRADPTFGGSAMLLAPLEATQAGREALAARLAERPRWLATYLDPTGSDARQIEGKAQMLVALAGRGGALGCDAARPITNALLSNGSRAVAAAVWRGHCPIAGVAGEIGDADFSKLAAGGARDPFGWTRHSTGDVELMFESAGDGLRMSARNSANVSRLLLSQATALEPGSWRLSGTVDSARLVAGFDCDGTPGPPVGVTGSIAAGGQVLSIGDCPRQVLSLWLRPGAEAVMIGELRLVKVR